MIKNKVIITAPVIDLLALSLCNQEKAYRSIRQRGERNPSQAVKVRFKIESRIRVFVESDLWEVGNVFWLAA